MTTIVPGEKVDAQHVNLKLGPGLQQMPSNGSSKIISTRAGAVNRSANGSRWWIESNSRRVRDFCPHVSTRHLGSGSMFLPSKNQWLVLLYRDKEKAIESTSDQRILQH
jgi:hypothetical protein